MLEDAVGVPLVIGLVEVVKRVGMPDRWLPLVSLVLGVSYAFTVNVYHITPDVVIQGLLIGLASSGLYRGTKVVVKGE